MSEVARPATTPRKGKGTERSPEVVEVQAGEGVEENTADLGGETAPGSDNAGEAEQTPPVAGVIEHHPAATSTPPELPRRVEHPARKTPDGKSVAELMRFQRRIKKRRR